MKNKRRSGLNIMAMGFRGLPNVPGGVETHAAELYPRLSAMGAQVTVLGRSPHRPANAPTSWMGVAVRWLWSPRTQGVEALVHSFIGVLYAAVKRPDVLHVHAIGPWLTVPLAKLLGLKVVITHHGQDYLREKWGPTARAVLRTGERFGVIFADETIVISRVILESIRSKYGRHGTLIPNGVGALSRSTGQGHVEKYGLTPYKYVIQVSRLVPEKRQLDLIAAFRAAKLPGWKLLLVGGAQGSQTYANLVRQQATGDGAIVSTGFLPPPVVHELLAHAGIFVLPSSHEGLPISLLESMKLGTPVLASDIPANRETGLDQASYFAVGDIDTLAEQLVSLAHLTLEERLAIGQRLRNACARFDWDTIAEGTYRILERAAGLSDTRSLAHGTKMLGAGGAPADFTDRRVPPRLGESYRR